MACAIPRGKSIPLTVVTVFVVHTRKCWQYIARRPELVASRYRYELQTCFISHLRSWCSCSCHVHAMLMSCSRSISNVHVRVDMYQQLHAHDVSRIHVWTYSSMFRPAMDHWFGLLACPQGNVYCYLLYNCCAATTTSCTVIGAPVP